MDILTVIHYALKKTQKPSWPLFYFTKLYFCYFFILHLGFPLYWDFISFSNIIDCSSEFIIKLNQTQATSKIMTNPGWSPLMTEISGKGQERLACCAKGAILAHAMKITFSVYTGKNSASHSVKSWCEAVSWQEGDWTATSSKYCTLYGCSALSPWTWIDALLCCSMWAKGSTGLSPGAPDKGRAESQVPPMNHLLLWEQSWAHTLTHGRKVTTQAGQK